MSNNGQILSRSPWEDFDEENEKVENIFTKSRKKNNFNFNDFFNNFSFNYNTALLVLLAFVGIWLVSGIYEVKEGEQAAVMRFGKFVRTGFPGLNYHVPLPFEQVMIEKVNQSRRIEIGYRSSGGFRSNLNVDNTKSIGAESTMLTGDENIVSLNCDVMWHISNLEQYIFNVVNPEDTVKTAAESAIREVIGNTSISSILSDQKQEITDKIASLTQKILDSYNAGVNIEKVQLLKAEPPPEVLDAYRDVQTSKADKERLINQAQSYNNDVLPKARGEAAKIVQEAEGYKQEVISKAEGNASRFSAIYKQYMSNKSVTKDRLYLEAIENILNGTNKIIMSTNGVLPHMAIQQNKIKE